MRTASLNDCGHLDVENVGKGLALCACGVIVHMRQSDVEGLETILHYAARGLTPVVAAAKAGYNREEFITRIQSNREVMNLIYLARMSARGDAEEWIWETDKKAWAAKQARLPDLEVGDQGWGDKVSIESHVTTQQIEAGGSVRDRLRELSDEEFKEVAANMERVRATLAKKVDE